MAKFEALTLRESASVALAVCKAYAAGIPETDIEEMIDCPGSVDDLIERLDRATREANGFDEETEDA